MIERIWRALTGLRDIALLGLLAFGVAACEVNGHIEDDPYGEAAIEFDAYAHWTNGRLAVEAEHGSRGAQDPRGTLLDEYAHEGMHSRVASRATTPPTVSYPEYILLEITSAEGHTLPPGAPAHLMLQKTASENDLLIDPNVAGKYYTSYHTQWMFYERSHENTDLATFLNISSVPTKQDRPIYRKSEMDHIHINAFAPYVPLTTDDVTADKTILSTVTPWYVAGQTHLTALGVPTISDTDYLTAHLDPGDMPTHIDGHHLKLHLEHSMAMLRFHIGVTQDYSALREIHITGVTLKVNGAAGDPKVLPLNTTQDKTYLSLGDPTAADADQHVVTKPTIGGTPLPLPTDNDQYALLTVAYVKPSYDKNENAIVHTAGTPALVTRDTQLLLTCTYDVYDNSGAVVRIGQTAQNVIRLDRLTYDNGGNPQWLDKAPAAGHYYDIYLALDPTYLYSLSDHDQPSPITVQ